jgi:hypothetical protein
MYSKHYQKLKASYLSDFLAKNFRTNVNAQSIK